MPLGYGVVTLFLAPLLGRAIVRPAIVRCLFERDSCLKGGSIHGT